MMEVLTQSSAPRYIKLPANKEKHVCGARGFGYSLDDKCPACEENKINLEEIKKKMPPE